MVRSYTLIILLKILMKLVGNEAINVLLGALAKVSRLCEERLSGESLLKLLGLLCA